MKNGWTPQSNSCGVRHFYAKGLTANLSSLWRYRVGDWRVICDIQDENIQITVLRLGHRKDIYSG